MPSSRKQVWLAPQQQTMSQGIVRKISSSGSKISELCPQSYRESICSPTSEHFRFLYLGSTSKVYAISPNPKTKPPKSETFLVLSISDMGYSICFHTMPPLPWQTPASLTSIRNSELGQATAAMGQRQMTVVDFRLFSRRESVSSHKILKTLSCAASQFR